MTIKVNIKQKDCI